MKISNSLSIIIPYYNSLKNLTEVIQSLAADFPIIVVDNASQEIIPLDLQKQVSVIRLALNSGFSHAVNIGLQAAETDYVLILNPDISIKPEQILQLLDSMKSGNFDAVSPQLVDTQDNLQHSYHQPRQSFWQVLRVYSSLRFLPALTKQTVLPGACLLVRKDLIVAIGGWDERLWLWWEDVAFSEILYCLKKSLMVFTDINVRHIGGETFSGLSDSWKKIIFFHSLELYARTYFHFWQKFFVRVLTHRFNPQKLYPEDEQLRSSVVVPNMLPEILEDFFTNNLHNWQWHHDELIIVTSAPLNIVWQWRKRYPNIIFVFLSENRGFSHTVNTGFLRARGKHLITVNDDTILPDGWISQMVKAVKSTTGSVSPRVVSPDGQVESLGLHVLPKGKVIPITIHKSALAVNTANAAAVLYTRPALERVGLFDENFGSYLEDVDLGLRMFRNDFTHETASTVSIVHKKHQTSKLAPRKKLWQDVKNWWYVILKNTSIKTWVYYGPSIFLERARNLWGFLRLI